MQKYTEIPISRKTTGYSFGYKIEGEPGTYKQKPGPGYYEIQNSHEKSMKKSSTTIFPKSKRFRSDKARSPGPGSYNPHEFSQLNMSSTSFQTGQILSASITSGGSIKQNHFGLYKRDAFPDYYKLIPGPGTYDNIIGTTSENVLRIRACDKIKNSNLTSGIHSKSLPDLTIVKPDRSSYNHRNLPGPGSYEPEISYEKLSHVKAIPFHKAERDPLNVNFITKNALITGETYFKYNNYTSIGNSPKFQFGNSKRESSMKKDPAPTTYDINRSIITKKGATFVYKHGRRFSLPFNDNNEPGPANYYPKIPLLNNRSAKIGTGLMRPPLIQTDLRNPGPGHYNVVESFLNTTINGIGTFFNKSTISTSTKRNDSMILNPLSKRSSKVISQDSMYSKMTRKTSLSELYVEKQASPGPIYQVNNNIIGSNIDSTTLFCKADRGISLKHYENGIPGPLDYEKEKANDFLYVANARQTFKKESRKFLATINEHSIRGKIPGPGAYELPAVRKHNHNGGTFSKSVKNLGVLPSKRKK